MFVSAQVGDVLVCVADVHDCLLIGEEQMSSRSIK